MINIIIAFVIGIILGIISAVDYTFLHYYMVGLSIAFISVELWKYV